MSKPGEKYRQNEDHGRKQSSSKLVLFSFSSLLPVSVTGIRLIHIFALSPRLLTYKQSRAFENLFFCTLRSHGQPDRVVLPGCIKRCLLFQVWRTAWIIPCAVRGRGEVTIAGVTSWLLTQRWKRDNKNYIVTMDRPSACPSVNAVRIRLFVPIAAELTLHARLM